MKMAVATRAENQTIDKRQLEALKPHYLQALGFVERLHRLLLDVIKDELDDMGYSDMNSVQALLLYNIGDSELTAGELISRGYYQGSNVSYNVKKLVDGGYINHRRSKTDRRSVRISLTPKGMAVKEAIDAAYHRHVSRMLERSVYDMRGMETLNLALLTLERFWSDERRFR